jgi:hypothetical protein
VVGAKGRWLIHSEGFPYPILGSFSAHAHLSDSSNALWVQKEDPITLRICNAQAPPISKDSADRVRRGDRQLG